MIDRTPKAEGLGYRTWVTGLGLQDLGYRTRRLVGRSGGARQVRGCAVDGSVSECTFKCSDVGGLRG